MGRLVRQPEPIPSYSELLTLIKGGTIKELELSPRQREVQVQFKDGQANRCLSEEAAAFWRPRTQGYKRLREAERNFRRWQRDVVDIVEAIERERRSSEGLGEQDRKRPLR